MAAFLVKHMVGDKLKSVKGAVGGGDDDKDDEKKGEDPEVAEARLKEEEARREKFRQQEAERERMRQDIRDKYKIKKRTDMMMDDPNRSGQIGRKKKSPDEMAGDGEESVLPGNMADMTSKLKDGPGQLAAQAQEKCSLM